MLTIILIIALMVMGGILLNNSAMKKFKSFFSAMLGKGADKALEIDPVAVYKDKIEHAARELRGAVSLLENHAALITQLKRKMESTESEYHLIEERTKKYMADGNTEKAEAYALNLAKLEDTKTNTKKALGTSETVYKMQTEKIKALKEKIIEYKEKAGKLQSDLQISKADAEISTLTQKFDSNSLGFDDLKSVEDTIQNQIDKNESKAAVAHDLYTPDMKTDMENESRKLKAKEILDRLGK